MTDIVRCETGSELTADLANLSWHGYGNRETSEAYIQALGLRETLAEALDNALASGLLDDPAGH